MDEIHHANLIIGPANCLSFVSQILKEKLDFSIAANPDFLLLESQSFGIEDAKDLEKWAIKKPLLDGIKASLLIIKSISHEAQNALLKVLEEPPLGTYIFINLQSAGGILPTLLSRVKVVQIPKEFFDGDEIDQNIESKILTSNQECRFALVKSLLKKKDKGDLKQVIKNLEEIYYEKNKKEIPTNRLKADSMKKLLSAGIFASARGSSPKMLLEWLSCVIQ